MADAVDDIKARLDIVDVVSLYVQLKKTGRNFKGLCPFHSEKTPSFVVSSEKQICHCFGCNKGGDIFTFIQEVEGIEFVEALQVLADRAGVKVERDLKGIGKQKKTENDEYFKAHELSCAFFEKQLYGSNDGKKVLEYLKKRGIKEETIKEFRIGFSPNEYNALYPMLLDKGIRKDVLMKSGLISSKKIGADEVFDKFRGRLMFPIFDYIGRICGFGGRALKKDQAPKYLNSSENPIYNKSRVLYGLYHSKKSVKEEDKIVLVEGYFDVILPYQEGVQNLAAVSGTALSSEQVALIKRLTTNVVTCFDLDNAGFEATKRSFDLLIKEDMNVKTLGAFEGKDPADFVKEKGGDEFKQLLGEASDFVTFYISKLIGANDVSTVEGRKVIFREILPILKQMSSSNRDVYVRVLSRELSLKEQFIYDEIDKIDLPKEHPSKTEVFEGGKVGLSVEEMILALVLKYPRFYKNVEERLLNEGKTLEFKDIYNEFNAQYNLSRKKLDKWNLDKGVLAGARGKIDVLHLYVEEQYSRLTEDLLDLELEKLIDKVREMSRNTSLGRLKKEIEEADKKGDKEKWMELLREQQKLLS